jgi:hypothetical protein
MTDPTANPNSAPGSEKGGAPAAPGGNAPALGAGTPAPAQQTAPGAPGGDWRAALPPELRESKSLARYKDAGDLAKGFVELEKTLGRTGVRVPQDGDGPEVQAAWRKALGVPEAPEGYELAPPEGFPAERWDKEGEAEFRKAAHELGLPPGHAQKLMALYAQRQAQAYKAIDEARANAEANLRKEWGGDYDRHMTAVDQAFAEFARPAGLDENDLARIRAAGLGEKFARLLAQIGGTGAAIKGPRNEGGGRMGPRDAKTIETEIAKLRERKGFYDRLAPDHAETKAAYEALLAEKTQAMGAA